jgi:nucleoid-associated protein YgaU
MAPVGPPQSQLRPIESLRPAPPNTETGTIPSPVAAQPERTGESITQPERLSKIADPAPTTTVRTYIVKKKDTLWSIAKECLGSGPRWKEIVDANPGLDPLKLSPGQSIRLPVK